MIPARDSLVMRMFYTLIVIVTTVFVVTRLFPRPHEYNRSQSRLAARVKQLGLCANLYLSDNDERFPPDMSNGRGASKYLRNYKQWDDELLDTENGTSREWLGNGSLAFTSAYDVVSPSYTLMFFDSAPRAKFRNNAGARVSVAADTSARAVQESLFQQAIANHWVTQEGKR